MSDQIIETATANPSGWLRAVVMTAPEYKAIRLRLGTQSSVAQRLGVARSTIALRETGQMTLTPEAGLAISALPMPMKDEKTAA